MQHILRLGPLLSLLLLLGAPRGVAVAQTPPALSPIAQLLQPYLLPESAAPAGFHLSRVQERTNVLIAGLLQDPEQIRPQVARGRITGVRQLFQQGDSGPLALYVYPVLYRDAAGSLADLGDNPAAPGQTLTAFDPPALGDAALGLLIRGAGADGTPYEQRQIAFSAGRLEVVLYEIGPSGAPRPDDVLAAAQAVARQIAAQPVPPPSPAERALLTDQTSPAAIPYDAYTYLLASATPPVPPATALTAAYRGAAAVLGQPDRAPPALTSDDPIAAWAQFLPAYRALEAQAGAPDLPRLGYAAAAAMYASLHTCHTHFFSPQQWPAVLAALSNRPLATMAASATPHAPFRIERVLPGRQAEADGLQPGDQLLAIDHVTAQQAGGEPQFLALALGQAGLPLTLTLQRPGVPTPVEITTTRELVSYPLEQHQVLRGTIGYVDFEGFASGAAAVDALRAALSELSAADVSGWILDLRLSTGRSLSTLQRVAGLFLPPDTPVATTRGADGSPTALGSSGTPLGDQKPLVVLIGPGTVAAAEVLAQTLHDAGRATVVGSPSAGGVNDGPRYGLLDGGGVVISATAVAAGASQTPLEDTGVSPDVPVERSAVDLAAGEDPQLDAALALLQQAVPLPERAAIGTGAPVSGLTTANRRGRWTISPER